LTTSQIHFHCEGLNSARSISQYYADRSVMTAR